MLLYTHQNLGLSACLFGLDDVEVHLVTVEVSVVWSTIGEVEAERLPSHYTDFVDKHRHSVQ